jgi:hypothetical protein
MTFERLVCAVTVTLLSALMLVVGAVVPAAADWSEDFDSGFSETWTFLSVDDVGDPPATGVSEFQIIEAGADDYLRISHSTTGFADGGGGATDGIGLVSEVFTDVLVSAELNAAPADGQQSLLAVIARGDPLTGTAYFAGVDFASSVFGIARSDDFEFFLVPLAIDGGLTIDSNSSYQVEFELTGSSLTARLFDGSGTTLLSTISALDSFYTSGVSGVLVETAYDPFDNPVAPIVGTFDDVQAVPEPTGSVMLMAGGGFLSLLARRRSA